MATRYLQLDWKSSMLFEYSKTDKDGFEKHETQKGHHYRKYEKKGISGTLQNVGVRDSKIGQQLGITVKDSEGTYNVIQFNLYDQKGNVDNSYPESIIAHLGNLKKGQEITIFPYNLTAENQRQYDEKTEGREVRDKYYDTRAVSFKSNGEKIERYLKYSGEGDNVIPQLDWKEGRFGSGKKKPTASSIEVKNEFLLDELKRAVDGHLAYDGNNNSSTSNESKPKTPEKQSESSPATDDYDSLPF